jgi:hypothetical protein
VSVPVLSKARQRTRAGTSTNSPPLTSTPMPRGARERAGTATGVLSTRAQGQAMTSSTSAS